MIDVAVLFDGGSKGNPGQGYGSYRISRPDMPRHLCETITFDMGPLTNNEAEYLTLIQALHRIPEKKRRSMRLTLIGDSQTVLKQISGEFGCHATNLQHLNRAAKRLLEDFDSYHVSWIPRGQVVEVLGH